MESHIKIGTVGTALLEKRIVYEVKTNSDTTEGRGRTVVLGFYLHEEEAKTCAAGKGVMGTDAHIDGRLRDVAVLSDGRMFLVGDVVNTTYIDLNQIRAGALAKLTPTERAVLGLKGE